MRLGIHGRAGTGKSVAADILHRRLGFAVIDLDQVGHAMLRQPDIIAKLTAHFGSGIVTPAGDVDRQALGQLVFRDTAQLRALNDLVHPLIRAEVLSQLASLAGPVVVVGALLEEIGLRSAVDKVLHIDADETSLARHSPKKAHIRTVQRSRDAYSAASDLTITNPFTPEFEDLLLDTIACHRGPEKDRLNLS